MLSIEGVMKMELQEEYVKSEQKKVAKFELGIFSKMIICSLLGIFSFFISFE